MPLGLHPLRHYDKTKLNYYQRAKVCRHAKYKLTYTDLAVFVPKSRLLGILIGGDVASCSLGRFFKLPKPLRSKYDTDWTSPVCTSENKTV